MDIDKTEMPNDLTMFVDKAIETGLAHGEDALYHLLHEFFLENDDSVLLVAVTLYTADRITIESAATLANTEPERIQTLARKKDLQIDAL